jgi:hypothetical protein
VIVTRLQLYCDGDHGIDIYFPEDGAVDGAILTPHELRKEAKKAGWSRTRGTMPQDLCPSCTENNQ